MILKRESSESGISSRDKAKKGAGCEDDFQRVVTKNADAMVVLDLAGSVLYVNPAAESLFGLPSSEMIGEIFGFPLILREPVEIDVLRDFRAFVSVEMRMVEVTWTGEPAYLLSFRDITDRVRAEQVLRRSRDELEVMVSERTRELTSANELLQQEIDKRTQAEAKLHESYRFTSAYLSSMPAILFRRRNDRDWTMEFLSPGTKKLTGYDINDLFYNRKMSFGQLIHPEDRDRVWNEVQTALSDHKPYETTYRVTTANGKEKWFWERGLGRYINRKLMIEGYIFDITDLKRAEEAMCELKARAELYVDLMGHDINNFNHSAMGYLELALEALESEKTLGPDDKMLIERPIHALACSSALIDNVRKLQRLTVEGVKTKPTDLNKIFSELEAMNFHHGDRDVKINIQHKPGIMIDANELLKDVFVNLITNAVKHSDGEKPVTVNVKVEPVNENGKKYYRCIVEDDGLGISDEVKGKLFHRFQRGETKAHGKGLGLYLVRTLVEGYHGKVWVEDRVPGDHTKGARFMVMLPAAE